MATTLSRSLLIATLAVAWTAQTGLAGTPPPLGNLTPLPAPAQCIVDAGAAGCSSAVGLQGATDVTTSSDGRFVYTAASASEALDVFSRDANTGALAQLPNPTGCVRSTATGGCGIANGLGGVDALSLSADGSRLYAVGGSADTLTAFARDATSGALAQLPGGSGCVREPAATGCAAARALDNPADVVVTADQRNVYVASRHSDAVAAFALDVNRGPVQLPGFFGCVSDGGTGGCANGIAFKGASSLALSPDGTSLYVAATGSDAVDVLARDPATGRLTQLAGTAGCIRQGGGLGCGGSSSLEGATAVAVSPDGATVYVASATANSVSVFARNPQTGALTQLAGVAGCVRSGGGGGCTTANALEAPIGVTVAPDDRSVYVASSLSDAVAVFSRDVTTGALTQLPGTSSCVRQAGGLGCAIGSALDGAAAVAVTPDQRSAYVVSRNSGGVAVFSRQAAPSCSNVTSVAPVDRRVTIALVCSDPNGQPFNRVVVTAPGHGLVSPVDANGAVTYTPVQGYHGPDSFTFKANDGVTDSVVVTAAINVTRHGTGPHVRIAPGFGARRIDRAGNVRLKIVCPIDALGRCQGLMTLRSGSTSSSVIVGRAPFVAARGRATNVTVRLRRAGLNQLSQTGGLRVTILAVAHDRALNSRNSARLLLVLPAH